VKKLLYRKEEEVAMGREEKELGTTEGHYSRGRAMKASCGE